MKAHILKLAAILLLFTVVSHSCEKEDTNKLPPETQEGKNTFGCYINDDLFVRIRKYNSPGAVYYRETKGLFLGCSYLSEPSIDLYIENPREAEYNPLIFGYISHSGTNKFWQFVGENTGSVFLTKFDTINRIVSGTFEFSARSAKGATGYGFVRMGNVVYVGDSTVHITKGRFDIKLDVYDKYE
jgi:hypothetical protein